MSQKEKPLTEVELRDVLKAENLDHEGPIERLKRRCTNNGLPTTKTIRTGFVECWFQKTKGLRQILLERGMIDLTNLGQYTKNGKKDGEGNLLPGTSVIDMLANCKDFKSEKSILHFIGDMYGVEVMFTPKYHCELAGEGIGYAWGFAKCRYRRIPIIRRRNKEGFLPCVSEVLSRDAISVDRIRRFSRRARRYVCAYFVFHELNGDEKWDVKLDDIEKMVKLFKTHRCAVDFDKKFVQDELLKADTSEFVQKMSKMISKERAFK
jgi:hypothetical protein